jgi:hypothetical protein
MTLKEKVITGVALICGGAGGICVSVASLVPMELQTGMSGFSIVLFVASFVLGFVVLAVD